MIERTLSIVKPDAVRKNKIGAIISRFEDAGLRVVDGRMMSLSRAEAAEFYSVHREKDFFDGLVDFMISGPVFVQILEGENAVAKNREIMGATYYKDAKPGTIRSDFAESLRSNAVHGSDSCSNAEREISLFFPGTKA